MHLLQVTQADLKLFFESICGEVSHSLLQTSFPFCTVCVAKCLQKWQFNQSVSLAHCNDCYRSFDWGCLVTTIILLASLLWNLWWLASIPSSYLCNFFWGKYFAQKLSAVCILNMFLALFLMGEDTLYRLHSPNTKMLRICYWEACANFLCSRISCTVHKEEICITDFSF